MELGRRAGVPQSVISAYERGQREPSVDALVNLVAAAGFHVALALTPHDDSRVSFVGPVGRRLQRRRTRARSLLAERGFQNPAVFGSVARGDDRADSDIDILVDLPDGVGLIDLSRMAIDLETLIGAPVDLVPRNGLRPKVAADVTGELIPL